MRRIGGLFIGLGVLAGLAGGCDLDDTRSPSTPTSPTTPSAPPAAPTPPPPAPQTPPKAVTSAPVAEAPSR